MISRRLTPSKALLRRWIVKVTNHQRKRAKIAVLASAADIRGPLSMLEKLPVGAEVVAVGKNLDDWISQQTNFQDANILFVASANGEILSDVLKALPKLEWIQGIFAGLDHLKCDEFTNNRGKYIVTNAKGVFSSSLAEWGLFAAGYFNKNIVRFQRNQKAHTWETFTVGELRGKTMGIIGYGDIGRQTAKLAKAYGMRVLACRRRPELSVNDEYCDNVYGMSHMGDIFASSDFIYISAALTPKTEGMVDKATLLKAKDGCILINMPAGKGIRGAALDVFATEPLPKSSAFWDLPNVLVSSHNADMTEGFRHNSVLCFVENCTLWLDEGPNALMNVVRAEEGY
eukprot:GSChrysophyteH1.ASY1.ANO1.1663.1 assembled CDS